MVNVLKRNDIFATNFHDSYAFLFHILNENVLKKVILYRIVLDDIIKKWFMILLMILLR